MRIFTKKRRPLIIAISGAAVVAITATVVLGSIAARPEPSALKGAAGELAKAAAADDWGALPVDDEGQPIGEPEIPLDKNGEPIILPGLAEEKRSADQPLPDVDVRPDSTVLDTTVDTAGVLQLLLEQENPGVGISRDDCLLDWAATELPKLSGTFSGVMKVCDRQAAVMYGGYSTSVRDFNLHAQFAPDEKERQALSKVLFKNDHLNYASVATKDGKGVLIVATGAGEAATTENSAPIIKTEPVVPKKPVVLPEDG